MKNKWLFTPITAPPRPQRFSKEATPAFKHQVEITAKSFVHKSGSRSHGLAVEDWSCCVGWIIAIVVPVADGPGCWEVITLNLHITPGTDIDRQPQLYTCSCPSALTP